MNLDELRSVQSKERQTDSLQHLRESFYADVSAYIDELEDERDRVAGEVDDPYGHPEVRQLTDEIETAREVVEAIYDRRLGKLVKRATLAAADMPADPEGLTAEERELFDDLVGRIEANKAHVLDVLDADAAEADGDQVRAAAGADDATGGAAPERPSPEPDPAADAGPVADGDAVADPGGDRDRTPDDPVPAAGTDPGPPADHDPAVDPAAADPEPPAEREHGSDPIDPATADPEPPDLDSRTTVRITGEVGEFYGVDDREYDLDREDVVTLPEANAEPLLQAGDAERLD